MHNLIESFPEEMKIDNNQVPKKMGSGGSKKPKKKMRFAKTTILVVLATGVFLGGVTLVKYGKNHISKMQEQKEIEALLKQEAEAKNARLERVANNKVAYLTFDDGPNANTEKVLDILKENNIKATFFLVGDMVKNNPNIVKDIYDAGHTIGNHTMSHSYNYETEDEFISEVLEVDKLISEAIGEEYNSLFVRVPGGSMGKTVEQNAIANAGLRSINWTGLSGDSERGNTSSDYILKRLKETVGDDKYEVVLMHDIKSVTVNNLQKIIDFIKEEGYIFEPLMEDSPVYFK